MGNISKGYDSVNFYTNTQRYPQQGVRQAIDTGQLPWSRQNFPRREYRETDVSNTRHLQIGEYARLNWFNWAINKTARCIQT